MNPLAPTLAEQQRAFDAFRRVYNDASTTRSVRARRSPAPADVSLRAGRVRRESPPLDEAQPRLP